MVAHTGWAAAVRAARLSPGWRPPGTARTSTCLLLDAPPGEALAGQRARGRVVAPRTFARHSAGGTACSRRVKDGDRLRRRGVHREPGEAGLLEAIVFDPPRVSIRARAVRTRAEGKEPIHAAIRAHIYQPERAARPRGARNRSSAVTSTRWVMR
ncbi:hypothetical protein GCM10020220_038410 [Nonomuraea rubra]